MNKVARYDIGFAYKTQMWGNTEVEANNEVDAEAVAKEWFNVQFDPIDNTDFKVESMGEIIV